MTSEAASAPAAGAISRRELIGMVAALIAVNAMAIDIMLPGLQQIGEDLGVAEENRRQLVVTAYLMGFGLFQILFGPLSDRFGRRRPLLAGLAIYVAATLLAPLAQSFEALLALRFLQGAGGAASVVIGIAFVRDNVSGRDMAEVMSMVMMVFLTTPIVAPAIGQAILLLGEWRLVFGFMGAMAAAIAFWVFRRMPETLDPADRRPFTPRSVVEGFGHVAANRLSMLYILATGFVLGALFSFINSAQQIYVGLYGLGVWFPAAFAGVAAVMSLGSFVNARLVGRFGMRRMSHFALLAFMGLSAVLAALASLGPVPFPMFITLFAAIMLFFSWIGSNFGALAMEPLGHVAGTAASAQGCIQVVGGGVIGALIGQAFDGTVLPIALGYVGLSAVALVLVLIAERGRLFGKGERAAGRGLPAH
jgi:DHA1 family bicyclomycin/chloramphenicol resistance-like MFS transporter